MIEARSVTKQFGTFVALDDVSVEETYQNFQPETAYALAALLAFIAMACLVIVAILRPKEES